MCFHSISPGRFRKHVMQARLAIEHEYVPVTLVILDTMKSRKEDWQKHKVTVRWRSLS